MVVNPSATLPPVPSKCLFIDKEKGEMWENE